MYPLQPSVPSSKMLHGETSNHPWIRKELLGRLRAWSSRIPDGRWSSQGHGVVTVNPYIFSPPPAIGLPFFGARTAGRGFPSKSSSGWYPFARACWRTQKGLHKTIGKRLVYFRMVLPLKALCIYCINSHIRWISCKIVRKNWRTFQDDMIGPRKTKHIYHWHPLINKLHHPRQLQ